MNGADGKFTDNFLASHGAGPQSNQLSAISWVTPPNIGGIASGVADGWAASRSSDSHNLHWNAYARQPCRNRGSKRSALSCSEGSQQPSAVTPREADSIDPIPFSVSLDSWTKPGRDRRRSQGKLSFHQQRLHHGATISG